jgi:hypothetical protein
MYEKLLFGMLFIISLIMSASIIFTEKASAQLGPVPLPAPQLPLTNNVDKDSKDTVKAPSTPLRIQVTNQQLNEGKNVVRIQVFPEREITNCMMYYVVHSANKIAQCVRESGSIYKGLIEAEYPTQTIEVELSDDLGGKATIKSVLSVHKSFSFEDILHVIGDWICKNILEC